MPIGQVQGITIWSSPHIKYVSMKNRQIFKVLPNLFGIADDILVAGYDSDGRDHDNML